MTPTRTRKLNAKILNDGYLLTKSPIGLIKSSITIIETIILATIMR